MAGWNLPIQHTIGQFVSAVLSIDSESDALDFYTGCIAHVQAQIDAGTWKSPVHDAVRAAWSNIGWCFGEGMSQERVSMWTRICGASHPVFGTRLPSLQDAFEMGRKAAY